MNVKLDSSWKRELKNTFNEPYFLKLITFVKEEYQSHVCYPLGNNIFSALVLHETIVTLQLKSEKYLKIFFLIP